MNIISSQELKIQLGLRSNHKIGLMLLPQLQVLFICQLYVGKGSAVRMQRCKETYRKNMCFYLHPFGGGGGTNVDTGPIFFGNPKCHSSIQVLRRTFVVFEAAMV